METRSICDLSLGNAAWQVVYLVRQLLPCAVQKFVGRSVARGLDRMVLNDQRIQLDHLIVIVQHRNSDIARHRRRQRRNIDKCSSLAHLVGVGAVLAAAIAVQKYQFSTPSKAPGHDSVRSNDYISSAI